MAIQIQYPDMECGDGTNEHTLVESDSRSDYECVDCNLTVSGEPGSSTLGEIQ